MSVILTVLRIRMPLSSPVLAEIKKRTVTIAIMITCMRKLLGTFVKKEIPPFICTAPNPSVVAIPARVAMIAITSMALPKTPSV